MDESSRLLSVKRKKNKKTKGAQAFFFEKSQLFLRFFARRPLIHDVVIPSAVCQGKSGSAGVVVFLALSICSVIATASSKDCRADSPETTGAWLACTH